MPTLLRRLLIGRPLATAQAAHERLTNLAALAVFAADGVSSSAYATEEIVLALAMAGTGALSFSVPVAIAIAVLIAIVAFSYRQVVYAYPHGGGSYAVASENLGVLPGQIVGASLLVDYVLTVAVSVASGVAAITSAFPVLFPYRVWIGVFSIGFVTWANLRGVRESARVFMLPVYGFVLSLAAMILVGLWRMSQGLPPIEGLPTQSAVDVVLPSVGMFLLLRAFASGCAALTGIEAVSNGVQAFKEPVAKNASIVLSWLAGLLAFLFLGITILAKHYHVVPVHDETVVSQVARAVFGKGTFYFAIPAFTALILILAANTSFNGFPRLACIQAQDGFLPRQLANLGDRLVYANGIIALGVVSAVLLAVFKGDTHRLIPLYAVGVFISFTLSQAGLVKHWYLLRATQKDWKWRAIVNATGAVITGIVVIVVAVTKFMHGAWIVVVIIPCLVAIFLRIKRHYTEIATALNLRGADVPLPVHNLVVVLVGSVHRGMLEAVQYAKSLSHVPGDVRGVHLETESDRPRQSLVEAWDKFGLGIPLDVVKAPYRSLVEPLVEYMNDARKNRGYDSVTLVLPEFVVGHWWEHLLHNQTALMLQIVLHGKPHVVIANYRYYLLEKDEREAEERSSHLK